LQLSLDGTFSADLIKRINQARKSLGYKELNVISEAKQELSRAAAITIPIDESWDLNKANDALLGLVSAAALGVTRTPNNTDNHKRFADSVSQFLHPNWRIASGADINHSAKFLPPILYLTKITEHDTLIASRDKMGNAKFAYWPSWSIEVGAKRLSGGLRLYSGGYHNINVGNTKEAHTKNAQQLEKSFMDYMLYTSRRESYKNQVPNLLSTKLSPDQMQNWVKTHKDILKTYYRGELPPLLKRSFEKINEALDIYLSGSSDPKTTDSHLKVFKAMNHIINNGVGDHFDYSLNLPLTTISKKPQSGQSK
jgi:hypothetical protein